MINLMPTDRKAEIRAARTNLILIRYISIIILALVFILGSMYITYSVLGLTKASSEEVIATNDTKAGVYRTTQAQVTALSASLAESKVLLDQEVRFSKVFVSIAQEMPEGTLFGELVITSDSFNGAPVTTKLYAKSIESLNILRDKFTNSPLFSGVTINTIIENDTAIDTYPVSGDIVFSLNRAVLQ